ncbi:MAG: hypothetical protein CL525_16195 [Aequorivita sp.]|nr:hypothetical protein [Aequorivita sp.]
MNKKETIERINAIKNNSFVAGRTKMTKRKVKGLVLIGGVVILVFIWLLGRLIEFVVTSLFQLVTSIF